MTYNDFRLHNTPYNDLKNVSTDKKVKRGPTDRPTNRPTDRPTDRRTDKAGCRVAQHATKNGTQEKRALLIPSSFTFVT